MSRLTFPRTGNFGLIHADPPWAYATRGNGNQVPARGEQPYETMTLDELMLLPVRKAAADDCVLILWVISSHVEQSFQLARSWGFTYKSLGPIWCKTQKGDPTKPKMGMGHWVRQEAEITFLFTRGNPKRVDAGVRQMIFEPAREHSRKPDGIYPACERLVAGPYLDLFGRCTRPGWTVWGNEATKFDGPEGCPMCLKGVPLHEMTEEPCERCRAREPKRRSREDLLG